MKRILVAGIGNIFHGDDAFGCEVVRNWPGPARGGVVELRDFGISSYDLAYALTGNYDMIVLVDAVFRGGEPGTLYLIEPNLEESGPAAVDAHSMDVRAVLHMTHALGKVSAKLYLVGCEPDVLENANGALALSARVQEAVEPARRMIESVIAGIFNPRQTSTASMQAV